MWITGRMRTVSVLLAFQLLVSTAAAASTSDESRAAAALFDEYEMVFYTNADLSSVFTPYKGLSRMTANFLNIPFGSLPMGLDALDKHVSAKLFSRSDAVLTGAKDFIPPKGAGSAGHPELFCYVLVFGKQELPDIHQYFTQAPVASAAGGPVWRWYAQWPGVPSSEPAIPFYAALVGHSYLVFSNDVDQLQTVAKKLTSSEDTSRTLNGIRDWAVISQHEYWGYRRFHRNGVLAKDMAGLDEEMPGAEAVLFFIDVKKKAGVFRLLSSRTDQSTVKKLNEQAAAAPSEPFPALKPHGAGVWDAAIPLSGGEMAIGPLFYVFGYFGFEILI